MASSSPHRLSTDICVVGAGIVGLAHALEARRRGLGVVIIDRDAAAVGASVANFGHLFFGSQSAGPGFELALRARERWLEIAPAAGIELVTAGTLILARARDELAVLETALEDPRRRARLLGSDDALALAPVDPAGIIGALHSGIDLRVNPRQAVSALAGLLASDPGVRFIWNAQLHAVEPGRVHVARTTGAFESFSVDAAEIIVCPGPDFRALPPVLVPGLESLTRCRLQMLRVRAPGGRRYGPALATGLSLIRYPAFAAQPPTAALRARLWDERPELLERGIHLLVTQLPDGDLVIGDSHSYGDTLDRFSSERVDELLLAEATALLGGPLRVAERWQGIYATRARPTPDPPDPPDPGPFQVTAPLPGVRVVENVTGIGMTLSLGFAAAVLDASPQSAAATPS